MSQGAPNVLLSIKLCDIRMHGVNWYIIKINYKNGLRIGSDIYNLIMKIKMRCGTLATTIHVHDYMEEVILVILKLNSTTIE